MDDKLYDRFIDHNCGGKCSCEFCLNYSLWCELRALHYQNMKVPYFWYNPEWITADFEVVKLMSEMRTKLLREF